MRRQDPAPPRWTERRAHLVAEVGRQVRAARRAHGWAQRELAERAGVAQSTICRMERGELAVTSHTLYAVAFAMGGLTIGARRDPDAASRPAGRL